MKVRTLKTTKEYIVDNYILVTKIISPKSNTSDKVTYEIEPPQPERTKKLIIKAIEDWEG